MNDGLTQQLAELEAAQLLRHVNEADPTYVFKHVLTQETAYQSLLMRRRRALHRLVAEAYESLFADRLDEYASLLAHHYSEAGDDERTLAYRVRAADVSAAIYANAEAVEHYTRALDVARRLPVTDDQLIHIYTRRGRCYEVAGQYDRALANYQAMEALAAERDAPALEIAALIPQATIYATPTNRYDMAKARATAERTLQLARAHHNARAEAKALWNLMLLENFSGTDPRRAQAYGEASLAIARSHNLQEETAYALHDLARPYVATGGVSAARDTLTEAIAMWREMGNLPMLADGLTTLAGGLFLLGQFEAALTHIHEALDITRAIGNHWGEGYAVMMAAPIYLEQGDLGYAIQSMEDILAQRGANIPIGPSISIRAILAFIYGLLGMRERSNLLFQELTAGVASAFSNDAVRPLKLGLAALLAWLYGNTDDARAWIQEAYAAVPDEYLFARDVDWPFLWLVMLKVGLGTGEHALVLDISERAIRSIEMEGHHLFLADMLAAQAQALHVQGQGERALPLAQKAWAEAERNKSRRALWELLPVVYELAVAQGRPDVAAAARQRAREVIQFVVAHIHQPDVRAAFLALPHIQKMLAD